jgi:hypothetical protein
MHQGYRLAFQLRLATKELGRCGARGKYGARAENSYTGMMNLLRLDAASDLLSWSYIADWIVRCLCNGQHCLVV